MNKLRLLPLLLVGALLLPYSSCKNTTQSNDSTLTDSAKVAAVPLKGDDTINRATRFYAGVSREGIEMSEADAKAWDKYSEVIKQCVVHSNQTGDMVDSIARTDFADFRDSIDYVYYPFSGADFMYPITIYPNADTYFMCGLEKTGTPISGQLKTNYSHYEAYRAALQTFFRASYFITKEMSHDFHNTELDGVCPVLTMLMAVKGYEIISIKYMTINANGEFVASNDKSNALEFKFFKPGSTHEQTLYYVSGDVQDDNIDPNLKKYLENTLPKHKVGSYFKAASFLCHWDSFSIMRGFAVNYSKAVIEDDSGIPYRFFTDNYDVTLYGIYKHPSSEFSPRCHQPELQELYARNASTIHKLPFRIGYNYPSNWLVARRKAGK